MNSELSIDFSDIGDWFGARTPGEGNGQPIPEELVSPSSPSVFLSDDIGNSVPSSRNGSTSINNALRLSSELDVTNENVNRLIQPPPELSVSRPLPIPMPSDISDHQTALVSTPVGFPESLGTIAMSMSSGMNQNQFLHMQQQQVAQIQQQRMIQQQQPVRQVAMNHQRLIHQQQLQNQQQGMKHQTPVGGSAWQTKDDIPQRRKLIVKIISLLQQRKPDAPAEWLQKLPDMARRLEDTLYRTALSVEEYSDFSTLKQRLQRLAMTMGARSSDTPNSSSANRHSSSNEPLPMPLELGVVASSQQASIASAAHASRGLGETSYFKQSETMDGIQQGFIGSDRSTKATTIQQQHVLRQQQQRLLLLRHASKCLSPEGSCQTTPHCAAMKRLWSHIAVCKDQRCPVSHCVSSRYVLSHYHRCKDVGCAVCGPVREAIRRHQETMETQEPSSFASTSSISTSEVNASAQQKAASNAKVLQALQAKAAEMTQTQLIQEMHNTRAAAQQAISQAQLLAQQVKYATQAANTANPQMKRQRIEEANAKRAQAIAARQRVQQLQIQFQAFMHILKNQGKKIDTVASETGPSLKKQRLNIENSKSKVDMSAKLSVETSREKNGVKVESDTFNANTKVISTSSSSSLNESKNTITKSRPKYTTEGTSMLTQLSSEDIQAHLDSLRKGFCSSYTSSQLKLRLQPILKKLMDHEFGWVFNTPVDPVALGIPDYFTIVKHPMDLGTIKKKLEATIYSHLDHFASHIRLVFNNAMLYNEENSDVYTLARDMLVQFEEDFGSLSKKIEEEECKKREAENACRLCGGGKFTFEPIVLYCNGPCSGRIRRNSYYYTTSDNKYHWCQQCYNDIKEPEIQAGDKKVKKNDLMKKKHDELHEEPWVQCDNCERWVHQICSLFNGRKVEVAKNSDKYHCPCCLLELRANDPSNASIMPRALGAYDLQRTKLSDYIEERIAKVLSQKREEESKMTGLPLAEIETADKVFIRQVSNVEKTLTVREKMYNRYKESHNYPAEFLYKSKCLLMFQEMDGIDTLLFGMYVHEFDEKEAEPNNRRVNVSYLDSVQYFRPKHLRTLLYHEVLISYLAFVKQRGFHTAHIWACPPLKGDDYILYCHPEEQKTPKSERLRAWYVLMLIEAQKQGIVIEINNFYSEFWKNGSSASVLPYFEGDYWVGVAEDFIKSIEEDSGKRKVDKKKVSHLKKETKSKSIGVKKSNKSGNIISDEGDNVCIDSLMKQLGTVVEPMKDDFIVVKLQYYCCSCNKVILTGYRWRDPSTKTSLGMNPETVEYNLCDSCYEDQLTKPPKEQHPIGKDEVHPLIPVAVKIPEKTLDPDDIIECEFFDTRQAFLSLCQGNHYQFDQLRRSKHTSMMLLYHLHNPAAPAYIYVCNNCQNDITTGKRWHCEKCSDFDVCDNCKPTLTHEHPLTAMSVVPSKEDETKDRKARQERKRNIQLHLQLLVHASACRSTSCPSPNCAKMKALINHGGSCKKRATGGCNICRRIWALLQMHARQCRKDSCVVPRCKDLKEHLRRLQQQQQQMEDRRRAAATEHYRNHSNEIDHNASSSFLSSSTPLNTENTVKKGAQKMSKSQSLLET